MGQPACMPVSRICSASLLIPLAGWKLVVSHSLRDSSFGILKSDDAQSALKRSGFIVWDAMEVTTFSRKHTANVHDALPEISSLLDQLVKSRDQRRDAFVRQMTAAQTTVLGDDRDDVMKSLTGKGIPQNSIREALNMVAASGSRFSVFALVDALTRISGRIRHAGDRAEIDSRIGRLLTLVV